MPCLMGSSLENMFVYIDRTASPIGLVLGLGLGLGWGGLGLGVGVTPILSYYWFLARILLLLLFYSFGLIRILSAPSLLFLLEYSPSVYSDFPATIPFLFSYSYSSFPFLQGVGIEVGQ